MDSQQVQLVDGESITEMVNPNFGRSDSKSTRENYFEHRRSSSISSSLQYNGSTKEFFLTMAKKRQDLHESPDAVMPKPMKRIEVPRVEYYAEDDGAGQQEDSVAVNTGMTDSGEGMTMDGEMPMRKFSGSIATSYDAVTMPVNAYRVQETSFSTIFNAARANRMASDPTLTGRNRSVFASEQGIADMPLPTVPEESNDEADLKCCSAFNFCYAIFKCAYCRKR